MGNGCPVERVLDVHNNRAAGISAWGRLFGPPGGPREGYKVTGKDPERGKKGASVTIPETAWGQNGKERKRGRTYFPWQKWQISREGRRRLKQKAKSGFYQLCSRHHAHTHTKHARRCSYVPVPTDRHGMFRNLGSNLRQRERKNTYFTTFSLFSHFDFWPNKCGLCSMKGIWIRSENVYHWLIRVSCIGWRFF